MLTALNAWDLLGKTKKEYSPLLYPVSHLNTVVHTYIKVNAEHSDKWDVIHIEPFQESHTN